MLLRLFLAGLAPTRFGSRVDRLRDTPRGTSRVAFGIRLVNEPVLVGETLRVLVGDTL